MFEKYLENLEFRQLLNLLGARCTFSGGRGVIGGLNPLTEAAPLNQVLALVTDAVRFLEEGGELGFSALEGVEAVIPMLKIENLTLDVREILALLDLVETTIRARTTLTAADGIGAGLLDLGRQLPVLQSLQSFIRQRVEPNGEIPDRASPELAAVRRQLRRLTDQIHETYQKLLQRLAKKGGLQDAYITVRNNRYVIPVRTDTPSAVPGIVHGRSSSGLTMYIEPMDTVPLNNQFIQLQEREREIIEAILAQVSAALRSQRAELESAFDLAGRLDSLLARAHFSRDFHCVIPRLSEEFHLLLEDARHPLLENVLRAQDKVVVPVSLKLTHDTPCLIISGPNTGGKTVALKTAGLLTIMALSGIPVPARDMACGLFRHVFADIGDQQSIAQDLSTFSSHVLMLRHMIRHYAAPSLLLIDELGTGTDPEEGSALGMAVLDYFSRLQAPIIITTHAQALKEYSVTRPHAAMAAVEIDPETLEPTYRLHPDMLGQSSGLFIARKLGIPEDIIQAANLHLSEQSRLSDQVLEKLNQLVRRREEELASITRIKHEQILKKIDQERRTEEQRRQLMQQLRHEFDEAMQRVRKEQERFLAELRREGTAGKKLEVLQHKSERWRQRMAQEVPAEIVPERPPGRPATARLEPSAMHEGMTVLVGPMRARGRILGVDAEEILILVGDKKLKVPPHWLYRPPADIESPPPAGPVRPGVTAEEEPATVPAELTVIGKTVDEALPALDRYLDQAYRREMKAVAVIHGIGRGILRRAIHEHLPGVPFVRRFYHPEPAAGGQGKTIIELDV
ncbi:MAG: Smr/MutS family protein [Acidobacteria bacterium]|nr:Smr/MutS family protein [Acidobacteriota bacterium]